MRKSFSAEFMAKVALEAIKEEKAIAELSSKYEVHRTQIANWRKRVLVGVREIFKGKLEKVNKKNEKMVDELYRQIGHLKAHFLRAVMLSTLVSPYGNMMLCSLLRMGGKPGHITLKYTKILLQ